MKNKHQRSHLTSTVVWFVGLIIVSILLSGCAKTVTPTVETPPVEATATPAKTTTMPATATPEEVQTPVPLKINPDDLAGVSLRFVHPWAGEGAEVIQKIATEFSLSNPWDIWVDVEAFGSEAVLMAQLQADLEQGDLPGLIAVHHYQLSLLEGDYFSVNLRDYFNDPDWGFDADAQADIPAVFLEPFTRDGNLSALPVAPQATVLFYNQTWGDELGFSSPPENEESFLAQSCRATTANLEDEDEANDGVGGWLINFDPNVLVGWYQAFGGQLPKGTRPLFNNPAGMNAFGFLKSGYDHAPGCFWIGRQPDPYIYFANRYALMYAGRLDQIPIQKAWSETAASDDEWAVLGFPGPDAEGIVVGGPGLVMTAEIPEKQMAAWLFARHLLEPKVQAKIARTLFTLPVRKSALDLLGDFQRDYPQWAQGVALVDTAFTAPVSESWAIAQWVLQDGVNRIIWQDASDTPFILENLDAMIAELEGSVP